MPLKEIFFRKLANGQNIYEFKKEIDPRGYCDPVLWLLTCIYDLYSQTSILVYISQISGEHLQDHWPSGFISAIKYLTFRNDF